MHNGIIAIDKPLSLTSSKVVSVIKKKFNLSKVGHGGTLDPLATGVLLLFLNRATKGPRTNIEARIFLTKS